MNELWIDHEPFMNHLWISHESMIQEGIMQESFKNHSSSIMNQAQIPSFSSLWPPGVSMVSPIPPLSFHFLSYPLFIYVFRTDNDDRHVHVHVCACVCMCVHVHVYVHGDLLMCFRTDNGYRHVHAHVCACACACTHTLFCKRLKAPVVHLSALCVVFVASSSLVASL